MVAMTSALLSAVQCTTGLAGGDATIMQSIASGRITLKTLKGPALFLAQFIGDTPPFDRLGTLAGWAAGLGYSGVQVPTSAPHLFDLAQAAQSQAYCDDVAGMLA